MVFQAEERVGWRFRRADKEDALATNIVMPQMGYDMREGTVVRWHKAEGEAVARGEVIAEIETDKATVEFEAFTSGVLRKIVAHEGIAIPVGDLIAVIADPDEVLPDEVVTTGGGSTGGATPEQAEAKVAPAGGSSQEDTTSTPPRTASEGQVRASPIARRLAQERGIDLTLVSGSGPGGRIVEKDLLDFASVQTPAESQVEIHDGSLDVAGSLLCIAPPGVGVGVIGIQRYHPVEVRDSPSEIVNQLQRVAPGDVVFRPPGCQLDGSGKVVDRVDERASSKVNLAAGVV